MYIHTYLHIHQYICVTPDPGFGGVGSFWSFGGFGGFSAPPLVPTGARELHGNSEPQPGGSKFCTAPPLASELHWPSLFGSFGNWASFWSLPKLFFLRRELAQCAGQFRMFFAAPAPICETVCRCVVSWHSVPGSCGRPCAVPAPVCGVCWHWSCRRCQCAGQFRTCFRFCGIGFGDPPPI